MGGANGLSKVIADRKFWIFLSNFSRTVRSFPNKMVVGMSSKSSVKVLEVPEDMG